MDTFNGVKGFAVLLIFSGVYLVTTSKSRATMLKSAKQPNNE